MKLGKSECTLLLALDLMSQKLQFILSPQMHKLLGQMLIVEFIHFSSSKEFAGLVLAFQSYAF
jgi:hypothetical protein